MYSNTGMSDMSPDTTEKLRGFRITTFQAICNVAMKIFA